MFAFYLHIGRKEVIQLDVVLATLDDIKRCILALNIANKALQDAIAAEDAAFEEEQIIRNKKHIRYKVYKHKKAREYLGKKVSLHKDARRNHFIKLSELKECIRRYSGVPVCCYKEDVVIGALNVADVVFNMFPMDQNEGHYQVDLISGEIVHLREYGEPARRVKAI